MPCYGTGYLKHLYHTSPTQARIFARKVNKICENNIVINEYEISKCLS
jgi:hypothetical protein